jgi:hypothetical protein
VRYLHWMYFAEDTIMLHLVARLYLGGSARLQRRCKLASTMPPLAISPPRDVEMEFEECASLSLRQLPFASHRTRRRESDGVCQFSTSRYGTAWFDSPSCWLGP